MVLSPTLVNFSKSDFEKELDIQQLVKEASTIIGPVWSLKNGIACNPLLAMENKQFWDAINRAESLLFSSNIFHGIDENKINRHILKSMQAFLDEGQATWKMPDRHLGFYRCWLRLALYDRFLIDSDNDRKILESFPEDPKKAIELGMKRFCIPKNNRVEYLAYQLAQLPGWAGYIKWQNEWQI